MKHQVIIENDVQTQLTDGVILRSTVYRPDAPGRFPVLLTRTPYGRDLAVNSAYFNPATVAANGFAVILQDVRGRHGSDGTFVPGEHEANDGAETVEWAADLPYSSGRVGMWGRSYFAETQWRAARLRPRGLAALAPGICAAGNADNGALFRGGAFELGSRLAWGHGSIALEEIRRECADDPARLACELEIWAELDAGFADGSAYATLPINDLKSRANGFLQSVILPSASEDPGGELSQAWDSPVSGAVPLPTLHIGGWFDIFLPNTLAQYRMQLETSHAGEAPRPQLIVGPWTHTNFTGTFPDVAFGALASSMAVNGLGELSSIHARWFDHVLNDAPDPRLPGALVYVMGENRWHAFDELPEPDAQVELFLGPDGSLEKAPGSTGAATYYYDPSDPVPTTGSATMHLGADLAGPAKQAAVESRDDVLTFTTSPLEEPVTVFGEVSATLFASSSAVDTDFVVRLCRVTPDGHSIGLADGIVRASWRNAFSGDGTFRPGPGRKPLIPGQVEEFVISLWSTACTFNAGDRIRIQVTSSCHPRWDRNLNTGLRAADSSETVTAHQRIMFGSETPSRITFGTISTPS